MKYRLGYLSAFILLALAIGAYATNDNKPTDDDDVHPAAEEKTENPEEAPPSPARSALQKPREVKFSAEDDVKTIDVSEEASERSQD